MSAFVVASNRTATLSPIEQSAICFTNAAAVAVCPLSSWIESFAICVPVRRWSKAGDRSIERICAVVLGPNLESFNRSKGRRTQTKTDSKTALAKRINRFLFVRRKSAHSAASIASLSDKGWSIRLTISFGQTCQKRSRQRSQSRNIDSDHLLSVVLWWRSISACRCASQ